MLLFIALVNLIYLLLPALISARATTPAVPVNLAAHHVKRLSTPSKNLLHKRDVILLAGNQNVPNGIALNSTTGQLEDTTPFEEEIFPPRLGPSIYFLVKGEIDEDLSVTVEYWLHTDADRRIGVFHGDLVQGVDMKASDRMKIVGGEARLYVVQSGGYDVLMFEAYGSIPSPSGASRTFPDFKQQLKRWSVGNLRSIEDMPNASGVQTLANNAGVDTSFSVE